MSLQQYPNLNLEKSLADAGYRFVLGIDEVGRGAIAGPVAVGIAVLDLQTLSPWPSKLRDSKLISAKTRQSLVPELNSWLLASGIGFASAQDIDEMGITQCLALAAHRAFAEIPQALHLMLIKNRTIGILDGSHNWLGRLGDVEIQVKTKADRDCASVAAASVLSKVARDSHLQVLAKADSRFEWASNKGYASASHIEALKAFGPTVEHRKTWLSRILGDNQLFDL